MDGELKVGRTLIPDNTPSRAGTEEREGGGGGVSLPTIFPDNAPFPISRASYFRLACFIF